MLFSIVTITKNNPDGFARTRDSLGHQSCTDYEWIVIDGAIELDTGIFNAMNKGMDRARGDYVLFMNAGDIFADAQTLSRITTGADFIYGDAIEDGRVKPARHNIAHGMITHHQAMLYRRAVIGDLRYDTQYHIAADYKFTAQFLERAATRAYLPLPLCVFEAGGISQIKTSLGRQEQVAIREELGLRAPFAQGAQIAAQFLKRWMPGAYWALRTRLKTSRA